MKSYVSRNCYSCNFLQSKRVAHDNNSLMFTCALDYTRSNITTEFMLCSHQCCSPSIFTLLKYDTEYKGKSLEEALMIYEKENFEQ